MAGEPVVLVTQEAEVGGSLETKRSRLQKQFLTAINHTAVEM